MAVVEKIEMVNHKGEEVIEEFELKPYGTPWQYGRDVNEARIKTTGGLDGDIFLCEKYLPYVVGKDRFVLPGQDPNLKFRDVLEEFFINDPTALQELSQRVGFFLYPAMKKRFEKQGF